ncbi:cytochrome c biogenesis protein ResB [Ornithinimicrobium sufpigmenti]|uniref:cytochrome c biogenesis protein ResB n=1 Tax=Ornithinimicrobium sufpigmenti TaxID=2508882 RepID=UPI001035AD10|nr:MULTISPECIES: cytochrome c biogenesis protein ResB [unclassified Ornithinimicrobium]
MATPTGEQQRIEPDYPKDRTQLGGPRLGVVGWARWAWRQLTSMRTALALLLLLAVAAIPGSIWPQRSVDPVRVRAFFDDNPELAPWLDRLYLFDVYSSPWFAAIYLLLMISLVGCILPRMRQHLGSLRAEPPRAPRRLGRMPVRRHATLDATPAEVVAAARAALGDKRFRLRGEDEDALAVSAEKGYLKETGNLVFHLALLGIIVAVGAGSLFGWRGEIIIKEGEAWTADAGTFDTLNLGPLVDELDIPAFTLTLERLDVEFESQAEGAQFGQPRRFEGVATVEVPGQEPRQQDFAVNQPLSVDGDSVYLLGNGYAPVVTVRDAQGEILFSDAVTFLPQDNNYGSEGAVKVPGRDPGLGLVGGFFPTFTATEDAMGSAFPGLADPRLILTAFEGELFPDGRPQSVFSIDTEEMTQLTLDNGDPVAFALQPGDTYELPDGTVVEFEGIIRWGGLLVRHDPGRMPALVISMLALAGLALMLGVKRRRVYVRVEPGSAGPGGQRHTGVTVAGLPKGTDPGLDGVVEDVLARIAQAVDSQQSSTTPARTARQTAEHTQNKDEA